MSTEVSDDFDGFYLHFLTSHTRAVTRWMHVASGRGQAEWRKTHVVPIEERKSSAQFLSE